MFIQDDMFGQYLTTQLVSSEGGNSYGLNGQDMIWEEIIWVVISQRVTNHGVFSGVRLVRWEGFHGETIRV